ncbi:hypothetical protein [Streptomyces sp. RKAG337]|uniref:hypothetical protein n=1 Tax=Streptomyces sp. RKAG337 TaxID=2893404 RepID=UPI002033CB45|nr:hypothetical protein [Streptomyces sp. RKAG337]MCM2430548.1 hypothetical protein [Streptomyces sp. RKAG337]
MNALRGTAPGRRGVLLLGMVAALAACGSTAEKADGDNVRSDTEPLERRFPAFGPLSDAHWLGFALGEQSRVPAPGPTDIRVVGFAQLRHGAGAAIIAAGERHFQPEAPGPLPGPLADFTPQGANWVRSASFDVEMTRDNYPGAFYLDPASDRVCFDTMNPSAATDAVP